MRLRRLARLGAVAFFCAYLVAVTWPGVLPFNRIEPFVLGLPFSLFWCVLWIVLGGLVLWALDTIERRSEGGR